jgi:hypothetical protein
MTLALAGGLLSALLFFQERERAERNTYASCSFVSLGVGEWVRQKGERCVSSAPL